MEEENLNEVVVDYSKIDEKVEKEEKPKKKEKSIFL
jgi:hypothetical protein